MERKAGILLPISSLPGKFGIGDFGPSARDAITIIKNSGFKMIQVLPLNPLGYGNSPYQSYSSYAIDPIYIDLEDLVNRGLLSTLPTEVEQSAKTDYDTARYLKMEALEHAVRNFKFDDRFDKFVQENMWVDEYANYMALKERDESKIWYQWEADKLDYLRLEYINESRVKFYKIVQYLLFEQWNEIRNFANECGLTVVGDIPIYVSIDSHDVWAHKANYLLDDDGRPTHVAGVPPDYFSEDGQLWGNPLYDWNQLANDNFKFWVDRLKHNRKMYDVIRIDHFRAFDTYWKIPYGDLTARNGEWIEAPGHQLFEELFKHFDKEEIIVEDLGDMRPEVFELRDDFELMGMKIIQFSLDPNESNNNFDDYPNLLLYTGTHDNQTLVGWYNALSTEDQTSLIQTFGDNPIIGIITSMFASVANYAIIPVQDILELDDSARFNTPGTVNDINWSWKLQTLDDLRAKEVVYSELIKQSNR